MDRGLVQTEEAFVGCRFGRARRRRGGRRGDDGRDVLFAPARGLEWLGPCGQPGSLASLATGTTSAAATRAVAAATHDVHHRGAGDLEPRRSRRVPGASPSVTPDSSAAVASIRPRHIPSAGDCAGAVDLTSGCHHR